MGKIIYLISALKTIDWVTIVGFIVSLGFMFYITFIINDCEDNLHYYNSEERIKYYTQKYNQYVKIRKKIMIFMLICILSQVLIPSKKEMYAIALTKDYKVEDMYQMSKEEIKDSIDYLFDKIYELKSEGL